MDSGVDGNVYPAQTVVGADVMGRGRDQGAATAEDATNAARQWGLSIIRFRMPTSNSSFRSNPICWSDRPVLQWLILNGHRMPFLRPPPSESQGGHPTVFISQARAQGRVFGPRGESGPEGLVVPVVEVDERHACVPPRVYARMQKYVRALSVCVYA